MVCGKMIDVMVESDSCLYSIITHNILFVAPNLCCFGFGLYTAPGGNQDRKENMMILYPFAL